MSKGSDFSRTFPPWKSGTKASGVPVYRLIIAGHLEVPQEKYSRKSSAVTFQLMYVLYVIPCKYRVSSNFNRASVKILAQMKKN